MQVLFYLADVTLRGLMHKYPEKTVRAADGEDSSRRKIYGENGPDKLIDVPVGIQVYDSIKRLIGKS